MLLVAYNNKFLSSHFELRIKEGERTSLLYKYKESTFTCIKLIARNQIKRKERRRK